MRSPGILVLGDVLALGRGPKLNGSAASGPAMTDSNNAVSDTVRAIGPQKKKQAKASGAVSCGIRPSVAFKPTTPVQEAGHLIEPPPSVPTAKGATPAARAALAPPLEPPGERSRFHGLRVVPKAGLSVTTLWANSGRFVLPMMIAPASRMRWTTVASTGGTASRKAAEPLAIGSPPMATLSLMVIGP